ncbi:hypothetical protein R6Q57_002641 [Mikania cordata]
MSPKKSKHEFAPKKIKLKNDSKMKLKKKKKSSSSNAVSVTDNRGVDSEWWISFWDKNPPFPGRVNGMIQIQVVCFAARLNEKTSESDILIIQIS